MGEAFSCAGKKVLPASVVMAEASEIMLLEYQKVVGSCTSACAFHTRMFMNMMQILAEKTSS